MLRYIYENILNVYFKFLLVKKRWNIFITCQQKMVHLFGARESTKKYIFKHSMYEYHVYGLYLGYKLHIVLFAVRCYHGNILRVYIKIQLVKKRWNIFITCPQKMVHLSGTRVSAKKYIFKHSMYEYHEYILGIGTTYSSVCSEVLP